MKILCMLCFLDIKVHEEIPSDQAIQLLMGILRTIAQFQKYADQAPEIIQLIHS